CRWTSPAACATGCAPTTPLWRTAGEQRRPPPLGRAPVPRGAGRRAPARPPAGLHAGAAQAGPADPAGGNAGRPLQRRRRGAGQQHPARLPGQRLGGRCGVTESTRSRRLKTRVRVRLPTDLYDALVVIARVRGESLDATVRRAAS